MQGLQAVLNHNPTLLNPHRALYVRLIRAARRMPAPVWLHGLDTVCLFLIGQFLVRPLMSLRAYIRVRAQAGGLTAGLVETTHRPMLGLFCVPGLPWALALVMQGQHDRATRILGYAVVRTGACASLEEAGKAIQAGRRTAEHLRRLSAEAA